MEKSILQIQDYLINNEIEPALNKLRSIFSIANSALTNDVIILSGQFKKLKSDVRKGTIDYAEESLRHSRVMDAVLSLLDEIKQAPDQFSEYGQVVTDLDKSTKERGKAALPTWVKDALFERVAYVKEKGVRVKALWLDDHPQNNAYESKILRAIGVAVDFVTSSEAGHQLLSQSNYEFILSDIARQGKNGEGLRFHQQLVEEGIGLPMIFYTANLDRNQGVPPHAFGTADQPNELLHLVLDVLERKY